MLDKLKSLFIIEDDDNEVKKEDTKQKEISNNTIPKTPETKPVNAPIANIDSKIIEKLLEAIEKNNLDGFDYLEYKNALKALEKMPMDEATKYRSAFATASTIGVTLDNLVKSAKFYVGILDKENQTFLTSFDSQVKNKISSKEDELIKIDDVIKTKSEQIKQLTLEIQEHQKQIHDVKSKLTESKKMMQSTQQNFKLSYENLKNQFEQDILKMQNYLK